MSDPSVTLGIRLALALLFASILVGAVALSVHAREFEGRKRDQYSVLALCLLSYGVSGLGMIGSVASYDCAPSTVRWQAIAAAAVVASVVAVFMALGYIAGGLRRLVGRRSPSKTPAPSPRLFGRFAVPLALVAAVPAYFAALVLLRQFTCN